LFSGFSVKTKINYYINVVLRTGIRALVSQSKDAATVAGAIGGAMVGDQIGSGPTTQTQCHTVYEQGPPAGYQVTYDYRGKLLATTTRNPPGDYLKIHHRVTVE